MESPPPKTTASRWHRCLAWASITVAVLGLWWASAGLRLEFGYDNVIVAAERFSSSRSDDDLRALVAMIDSGGLRGVNAAATLRSRRKQMSEAQIVSIVVPALVQGLKHGDGRIRCESVNVLDIAFSDHARPAAAELRKLLNDTADTRTPVWAAELLAKMPQTETPAGPHN